VDVGVACALGRQPVKLTASSIRNSRIDFFICFSMVSIQQFYQRKTESGDGQELTHKGLIFHKLDISCGKLQSC
jgi:hypothetical protein